MSNQLPDLLGNVIEEMILWERLPIPVDYPAPWLVSIPNSVSIQAPHHIAGTTPSDLPPLWLFDEE